MAAALDLLCEVRLDAIAIRVDEVGGVVTGTAIGAQSGRAVVAVLKIGALERSAAWEILLSLAHVARDSSGAAGGTSAAGE